MQNEETGEYDDYNKLLTISIYEVENRAITAAKVVVCDVSDEQIDEIEKLNEE